ncbi:F-box domain-containing protein [Mariannaea sp. PMI_226]|nr:F-box domain-containing protein [Mariannaea sp. PMI_226]
MKSWAVNCENRKPEETLRRFSQQLYHLLDAVITVSSPSKLSNVMDANKQRSSIGALDKLPTEILYAVLNTLDLQSISRFSRVSSRGRLVTQSLRSYRTLLNLAPCTVEALSRTGLLSVHSAATLETALRADRCTCCPFYGAFLFLLTCERCCWYCLSYHPSLRAISSRAARRFFCLLPRHIKQLPVLRSIPGRYRISGKDVNTSYSLVSARMARDLGISIHGSKENLVNVFAARGENSRATNTGRYLQGVSIDVSNPDPLAIPSQGNTPPDDFFGLATIPFPSLSTPEVVDNGNWCKGCQHTHELYRWRWLDTTILEKIVPGQLDPQRVLLGLERRARSRSEFLAHVKSCYGAWKLEQASNIVT